MKRDVLNIVMLGARGFVAGLEFQCRAHAVIEPARNGLQ